jgi:hypothetical protein
MPLDMSHLMAMLMPVLLALKSLVLNPQAMVGAVVAVVLMVRDFENTTQKLAKEAIPAAEQHLTLDGEQKLNMAVDYVLSMLPAVYFHGIPKQFLIPMIEHIVQMVFEAGFSHLEHSAMPSAVPSSPLPAPLPPAPPAPDAPGPNP